MRGNKSTVLIDKLNTANVIGSYTGNLPCVDCEAINTVLHLDRDNSYELIYTYDGKSRDEFVKKGDWLIDENFLILKGIDYHYKIQHDGLVQLDLSGEEITGDLAEKYQLIKVK